MIYAKKLFRKYDLENKKDFSKGSIFDTSIILFYLMTPYFTLPFLFKENL